MNLPETIKTARESLNMTQEDLAEKCEVSRQAVSKWELGASAPSRENLALLSEILGVPLEAEAEAESLLPAPAAGSGGRNPWKLAVLALAGLMAAALLSIWLYCFQIQPHGAPTEPESAPAEPAIMGVWFFDQDGTPLDPDLGDGWNSFSTGRRVYLLVSFRQGTETGVQGVSLFATPTGTETYDQRRQLGIQAVYDRTFALFPLDFPETTMYHLDITLECDGGQSVTETLNVTAVSSESPSPGTVMDTEDRGDPAEPASQGNTGTSDAVPPSSPGQEDPEAAA